MIFGELAWHFGRSNVDFNWDMECERIDNNRWFPFYLRSIHLILKHTHTRLRQPQCELQRNQFHEKYQRARGYQSKVLLIASLFNVTAQNCPRLSFSSHYFSHWSLSNGQRYFFFISFLIESKYTQHEQYPSHSNRMYCFK